MISMTRAPSLSPYVTLDAFISKKGRLISGKGQKGYNEKWKNKVTVYGIQDSAQST